MQKNNEVYFIFVNFSFLKLFILISFVVVLTFFKRNNIKHLFLLTIVFIGMFNEFLNLILISKKIGIGFNTNIYLIVHNSIWLYLSLQIFKNNKIKFLLFAYLLFCLLNLLFLQGLYKFNNHSFILGAIIYLLFFIHGCYSKLKSDDLLFFKSNDFILISSPILFFLGLSLIFGFHKKEIAYFKIFDFLPLFTFISYFATISYYTLINIYIYRERKLKNA
jgi:hypothetical protein